MPMELRSTAQQIKRNEQLKRWEDSETNKVSAEIPKEKSRKIQFSKGCIFLACCATGEKDEVEQLLQKGVDINTSNVDGLTALHQACIDGNLEMVEFLVARKCDINCRDLEGWTPLHASASCGLTSIVRFLVDHGADIAAVNNEGALPIDIAEKEEIIKILKDEMDKRGIDPEVARQVEEFQMRQDILQCLQDKNGAPQKLSDVVHPRTGATALHVAAAKGYLSLIKLLLEAGADVNAQDFDGWTPLHAAAHWSQQESCELLVLLGSADMEIIDHVGQTCFDVAEEDMEAFLKELQKKQVLAKLEANQSLLEQQQPLTRPPPPPFKRRTSVNRMSVIDKSNVIAKATIAERAPFADGTDENLISGIDLAFIDQDVENAPAQDDKKEEETQPIILDNVLSQKAEEEKPKPELTHFLKALNITPKEEVPTKDEFEIITVRRKRGEEKQEDGLAKPLAPTEIREKAEETRTPIRRSLLAPVRDEESEAQRKAHAKRVRETRRSTQGVTLEDVKSAEQQLLLKKQPSEQQAPIKSQQEKEEEKQTPPTPATTNATPSTESTQRSHRSRPILDEQLKNKTSNDESKISTTPEVNPLDPAKTKSFSAVPRRRRPKRRSTGVAQLGTEDAQEEEKTESEEGGEDKKDGRGDDHLVSSKAANRLGISEVPTNTEVDDTDRRSERKNYKKLYEELREENHKLQERLRRLEGELEEVRKQIRQDHKNNQVISISEFDKRERRALERKISELEEELKDAAKLREINEKLKQENGSLVRVVTRLSALPAPPSHTASPLASSSSLATSASQRKHNAT